MDFLPNLCFDPFSVFFSFYHQMEEDRNDADLDRRTEGLKKKKSAMHGNENTRETESKMATIRRNEAVAEQEEIDDDRPDAIVEYVGFMRRSGIVEQEGLSDLFREFPAFRDEPARSR